MAVLEFQQGAAAIAQRPSVSVVLPCLNEAASVAACVDEALSTLELAGFDGEVVVADNGSTDGSAGIARAAGARVVHEPEPGYGSALRAGIRAARGDIVVMADADCTYDLSRLATLVEPIISDEADLVLGARLSDANRHTMPLLHRFVGTPALSFLVSRACGGTVVSDSQSGYRAFRRRDVESLHLSSSGMEFASEMLIRASNAHLRITETSTGYRERVGESKLDTVPDGLRHLRLILLLAPHLLLVWPGVAGLLLGAILTAAAFVRPEGVELGSLRWQPMFFSTIALVIGAQTALGGMVLAHRSSIVGERVSRHYRFIGRPSFSRWCARAGAAAVVIGLAIDGWLFLRWLGGDTVVQAPALAGLAQGLLILGATTAAFSTMYRLLLNDRRRTVTIKLQDSSIDIQKGPS